LVGATNTNSPSGRRLRINASTMIAAQDDDFVFFFGMSQKNSWINRRSVSGS